MKPLPSALVLIVLLGPNAAAQQAPTAPARPARQASEEPRNEVALILAGTREDDETSFTIGGEYERHLTDRLGIDGEFEHVGGPDSWIFVVPFVFHQTSAFKLFAGPGLERAREASESDAAPSGDARDNLFLWRVGTAYSWEFSQRFVAGPTLSLDFIREQESEWTHALVFGIALGVAF